MLAGGIIFVTCAVAGLCAAFWLAPEGYQDPETGFHYGRPDDGADE